MFILIERNNDGCYMGTSLVAVSDDHKEVYERMVERRTEALKAFDYILPLTENDKNFNCMADDYASIGCDGDDELVEWYIFNDNNPHDYDVTC